MEPSISNENKSPTESAPISDRDLQRIGNGTKARLRCFFEGLFQEGLFRVMVRAFPSNPRYHGVSEELEGKYSYIERQRPVRSLLSDWEERYLQRVELEARALERQMKEADKKLVHPPELVWQVFEMAQVLEDGLHLAEWTYRSVMYLPFWQIRDYEEEGDAYFPDIPHVLVEPRHLALKQVGYLKGRSVVLTRGEAVQDLVEVLPGFVQRSRSQIERMLKRDPQLRCMENEDAYNLQQDWVYERVQENGVTRRVKSPGGHVLVRLREEVGLEVVLDAEGRHEGSGGGAVIREPEPIPRDCTAFGLPRPTSWNDVAIRIEDEETAKVSVGKKTKRLSFADLGMRDNRNGSPNVLWKMLCVFAMRSGSLHWDDPEADRKNKKRRSRLSDTLRGFFRLEDDPIRLTDCKKGWQVRFELVRPGWWTSPPSVDEES